MTNSKKPEPTEQRLRELYERTSKHSNYQVLPRQLQPYFPDGSLTVKSRHERERLDYILANLDVAGKTVMDIGGNTGYFTFELLRAGAASVTYCEGNSAHAEFVREAACLLGLSDRVTVSNAYFNFEDAEQVAKVDICLLLNVLHHVGDDYGDATLSIAKARDEIRRSLQVMSKHAQILVFQLGFNWKGDRTKGLFPQGTKSELVSFIESSIVNHWEIIKTAVPESVGTKIVYRPLSVANEVRRDDLGEFLNRPLFILRRI